MKDKLRRIRKTAWVGERIVCYDETDSTNLQAKALAEEGAVHGTLVLAEQQQAGRGRRGRSWESPKGSGIFMSLLLRPEVKPANASMLTLVSALAVAKAIRTVYHLPAEIKWPNDIVLNGRKICGILTEMSTGMETIHYVVIGIGINVSNREFPEEIASMATSLALESGLEIERAELIEAVWEHFECYYDIFIQKQDLSDLQEEYNKFLVSRDRQVNILDPKEPFTGVAKGITGRGELMVETESEMRLVSSGEVSVRGIYGYV